MKVLLTGGSGRTGLHLLEQLLDRGHEVHALVRNPAAIPFQHQNLVLVPGTPEQEKDLARAIAGCEAVIVSLNISRQSDFPWAKLRAPQTLISDTVRTLISLMQAQGVQRILSISASGAGDSEKEIPGWFKWLIRNSNIRYGYADHGRQENLLKESGLDWTIVRPVGLTNSEKDKTIRVSYQSQPKPAFTIPRRLVAKFIIDALESGEYIHKAPTLSAK